MLSMNCHGSESDSQRLPQRLKPCLLTASFGTAEAVPFQSQSRPNSCARCEAVPFPKPIPSYSFSNTAFSFTSDPDCTVISRDQSL